MSRAPRSLSTTLIDAIPLAAVWGAIATTLSIFGPVKRDPGSPNESMLYSVLILLLAPIVGGIWTLLRMAGRAQRLANREWRSELAMTLLDPREYLKPRFWRPFLWLTASIWTTWPILIALLLPAASVEPSFPFLFAFSILAAEAACAIAGAAIGSLDLMERLCRARSAGALPVVATAAWIGVMILGPIGFAIFAALALANSGPSDLFSMGLVSACGAGLSCWLAFQARNRWDRVVEAYYGVEVEPRAPGPRAMARPGLFVGQWIFAAFAGQLVGYGVDSVAMSLRRAPRFEADPGLLLSSLALAAVGGGLQWLALRGRTPRARWWVLLTLAGALAHGQIFRACPSAFVWLNEGFRSAALTLALGHALTGLIMGAFQGFALARRRGDYVAWALVCAAASALDSLAGFSIYNASRAANFMPAMFVAAAAYGALTGAALVFILRRQESLDAPETQR